MTLHEKKMNKQDLHSYKYQDHQINALVPGVSVIESIGTIPTNHGSQAKDYLSPRGHMAKLNITEQKAQTSR